MAGLALIRTKFAFDGRGHFAETYRRSRFAQAGVTQEFVQDNQSFSIKKVTLRGLHFQTPPFSQSKLVRVLRGRILDVVVDLRRASITYGQHMAVELTAEAGDQLMMAAGFAHGFCTMEDGTEVFYKVDNIYSPEHERGLNAFDPELGIQWPVAPADAILCDRDRGLPMLRDLPAYFSSSRCAELEAKCV